jgi:Flp pilus assembly protein CpaB
MKSKSIVLMAVSLGFGLVAAIGISQVMGRNNSQQNAPKQETRPVMVAIDHLDAYAELTEANVSIENWPATLVPPDAIISFDETKDKLLNCRVAKKMPLLRQMVVNRNEVNRLAIPKNYKVLGIKLPADDVIGGLLSPGDVVDLIGVFTTDKKNKVSRTFLTGIRVFSVNNKTAPDLDRGKSGSQGAIVGVLLTKSQAEKLILAQKVAQIKLVLRSEDNDSKAVASNEGDSSDGFSTEDFSPDDESTEEPRSDNDDSMLKKLLAGRIESSVSHQMVMVTPDGPVSFVFHRDSPLPERIDGYLMQASSPKMVDPADQADPAASDTDEAADSDDSGADSYNDDETEPAADSDLEEGSDSASNDQEDQFNEQ